MKSASELARDKVASLRRVFEIDVEQSREAIRENPLVYLRIIMNFLEDLHAIVREGSMVAPLTDIVLLTRHRNGHVVLFDSMLTPTTLAERVGILEMGKCSAIDAVHVARMEARAKAQADALRDEIFSTLAANAPESGQGH